jgi:serine/threonine protein kinase
MISDPALDRVRALLRDPDPDAEPGADTDRYELLSILGRGGMGTVYLAHDTALDREVALKVLESPEQAANACPADAGPAIPDAVAAPAPARAAAPAPAADPCGPDPSASDPRTADPSAPDPRAAARLAQEARILGRLEHPGIVPVHDFGRLADGRLFYAMKRVRGERLDRWAAGAGLPARLAVYLRICEAVSFAHAHGVIHRDLKPENVMTGEFGEVLVLDWGVARLLDRLDVPGSAGAPLASTVDTAHGTVVGTPAYMAPEQARGDIAAIDQRTDIYALGAMLSTLAAGSDSGALQAIITKACAERPDDRYQTAQDLAADVSRFVSGLAVRARREPLLDALRRIAARYRTPLLLILTYLLARLFLFWAFHV